MDSTNNNNSNDWLSFPFSSIQLPQQQESTPCHLGFQVSQHEELTLLHNNLLQERQKTSPDIILPSASQIDQQQRLSLFHNNLLQERQHAPLGIIPSSSRYQEWNFQSSYDGMGNCTDIVNPSAGYYSSGSAILEDFLTRARREAGNPVTFHQGGPELVSNASHNEQISNRLQAIEGWMMNQAPDIFQGDCTGETSNFHPLAPLGDNSVGMVVPAGNNEGDETKSSTVETVVHRTSAYRGVTRHRWTGRYEAHLWDNSSKREGQSRKGRQVYLGGYDTEEKAARAYDLAALKYWGANTMTNYPISSYERELQEMSTMTRQEYIASIRRKSSGFSRGASIYRGVTRHHQNGKWQARIGRVAGNKDLYLGTYKTQEEAAEAYDIAAIKFRGLSAVTNFEMSRYDVKAIIQSKTLPIGEASKRMRETMVIGPPRTAAAQETQPAEAAYLQMDGSHFMENNVSQNYVDLSQYQQGWASILEYQQPQPLDIVYPTGQFQNHNMMTITQPSAPTHPISATLLDHGGLFGSSNMVINDVTGSTSSGGIHEYNQIADFMGGQNYSPVVPQSDFHGVQGGWSAGAGYEQPSSSSHYWHDGPL